MCEDFMIPGLGSMGKDSYEFPEWSWVYDFAEAAAEGFQNYSAKQETLKEKKKAD